uniref:Uncharacterized protein n=1 Tax=Vombatus ursinus TaxID=29139 RepID=A0A4X2JV33_VOMUR
FLIFLSPPFHFHFWLSATAGKQRDLEITQQKQKKLCGSCPSLLPIDRVPGASPVTLSPPPVALTGPRTEGIPFALSLPWLPSVHPSPQAALLSSRRGRS